MQAGSHLSRTSRQTQWAQKISFPWTEPQISPLFHLLSQLWAKPELSKGSEKTHCLSKRLLYWVETRLSLASWAWQMCCEQSICCLEMPRSSASTRQEQQEPLLSRGKRREIGPLLSIAGLIPPSRRHTTSGLSAMWHGSNWWPLSWGISLTCRWSHPNWPKLDTLGSFRNEHYLLKTSYSLIQNELAHPYLCTLSYLQP